MADANPTPCPAAMEAYEAALADLDAVAAVQREIASNVHVLPLRPRLSEPEADACQAEFAASLSRLDPVWDAGDRLTMDWLNAKCMNCGRCPAFLASRGLVYIGGGLVGQAAARARIETLLDRSLDAVHRVLDGLNALDGDADLEAEPDREIDADREPDHDHEACCWPDEGDQASFAARLASGAVWLDGGR